MSKVLKKKKRDSFILYTCGILFIKAKPPFFYHVTEVLAESQDFSKTKITAPFL